MNILGDIATLGFLISILRISVPYILCGLGSTLSERGGITNIGLEGTLLLGAFGTVAVGHATSSPTLALVAGLCVGMLIQGLYGLLVLRFRADQIVCGVALNMLAAGVTRFLLRFFYGSSSNSPRVESLPNTTLLGALALVLLVLSHLFLFHTPLGLRLRACGENPEAAHAAGIRVLPTRAIGLLAAGFLGGLAGVWLASLQHQFVDMMSGGRGYIALAAMIFGRWKPVSVFGACLLFGTAEALQIRLQTAGIGIPPALLQTIPYVLTMVALAGAMGRARPPAALGTPWKPE